MNRNIRCSLAYLNSRLIKIEKFAWESGKYLPEHIIDKLSPAEINYFKTYLGNIEQYNQYASNLIANSDINEK